MRTVTESNFHGPLEAGTRARESESAEMDEMVDMGVVEPTER